MPRSSANIFLAALLLSLSLATRGSAEEIPQHNPELLETNLELLKIQMKVEVLRQLSTQAGFYVPPQWPKRYEQEYTELAQKAGAQAAPLSAEVDKWLMQKDQERANEAAALLSLLTEHAPKLVQAERALLAASNSKALEATPGDLEKKLYLQIDEFRKKQDLKALAIAKYVANYHKALLDNGQGGGKVGELMQRWDARVTEAYRGALRDQGPILERIQKHESTRAELEARLKLLKEYEGAFEIVQGVNKPLDTLIKKAEEKALEKADAYLKDRFMDLDPAYGGTAIKDIYKKLKGDYLSLKGIYDKAGELDKNITLRANPTALAAAKRFAVLGGLYKFTLGKLKDAGLLEGLGPIPQFLELYGNVLSLIPDIAIKVQEFVDTVDQRHKGVRALDAWNVNVADVGPGDLRQLEVFDAFGFQIATDTRIDMNAANARYYMLVPKDVIPRGYATFGLEQFARLEQAIADERFLSAPNEASRGIGSAISENIFDSWAQASPLAGKQSVSESYLKSLQGVAKKSPFKPRDLVDLANNQAVTFNGQNWAADKFRSRAEIQMDSYAVEQAIRTALGVYEYSYQKEWEDYVGLLRGAGLAFTPEQILKLFAFYHNSGAAKAKLSQFLKALADQRAAEARGTPQAGIPILTLQPSTLSATAGEPVEMSGQVIVSGLEPGKTAEATVTWKTPRWATPPAPVKLNVVNGLNPVALPLKPPLGKGIKDNEVQLEVTIKSDPAVQAVAQAAAVTAAAAPDLNLAVKEDFEIEGAGGPLNLTVTRNTVNTCTSIEMSGELLSSLKPDADIMLHFKLLAARDPAGPFRELDLNRNDGIYPWRENSAAEKNTQGWIAKDRYRIFRGAENSLKYDEQPLCYQVVATLSNDEDHPIKTAVAKPSGKVFIAIPDPTPAGEAKSDLGTLLCATAVNIGYADRYLDAIGARVKVHCRGWTGYAWAHGGEVRSTTNNLARIQFPFAPGPTEIELSVEGPYLKDTGKIKVAACAQGEKSTKYSAQEEHKTGAELVKQLKGEITTWPNLIKDKENEVKKYPDSWTPPAQLAILRFELRMKEEVDLPMAELKMQYADAVAAGKMAECLKLAQKSADLRKLRLTLLLGSLDARIQVARAYVGRDKKNTENIQGWIKSYEDEKKETTGKEQYWILGELGGVARAALAAGDAGALDAARSEYFKLARESNQTNFIPETYAEWAEETFMLTGDVAKANAMYHRAIELVKELDPKDPNKRVDSLENFRRPGWYKK